MFGTLFLYLIVFVIVLWLILHMILPIGVKRNEKPGVNEDIGAPENQNLKMKFITTIIISLIITAILYYIIEVKEIINFNLMVYDEENM